jgi:hypothetical protein
LSRYDGLALSFFLDSADLAAVILFEKPQSWIIRHGVGEVSIVTTHDAGKFWVIVLPRQNIGWG